MRLAVLAILALCATSLVVSQPAHAAGRATASKAPTVRSATPGQIQVGKVLIVRGSGFSPRRVRNRVILGAGKTASIKPFAASRKRLFVKLPGRVQYLLDKQSGKRIATRLRLKVSTRGKSSIAAVKRWPTVTPLPGPAITSGPSGSTSARDATFEFLFFGAASYTCRLDDGDWQECASPATYSDLDLGTHEFTVRAHNAAGKSFDTRTTRSWTVVAPAKPKVEISFGPEATTDSNSAVFVFSADQEGGFECSLDSAPFTACSSPTSYSGLEPGPHSFSVRVTNANGSDTAVRDWTVNEPASESEEVDVTVEGTSDDGLSFTGKTTGSPQPSEFVTFEATLSHDTLNGDECVSASGSWSYSDADGDLAAEFTKDSSADGLYCPTSNSYSFYWRQVDGGPNDTGSFTLVYDPATKTFTSRQNGRYTPTP